MSTAAEQEAERQRRTRIEAAKLYPTGPLSGDPREIARVYDKREAYCLGVAASEARFRELLEAAEAYRDSIEHFEDGDVSSGFALTRLLAAAAALPGGTDAERPPE